MPKSADRLISDASTKDSVAKEFQLFVEKMDYVRKLDSALQLCQYEVDPIIKDVVKKEIGLHEDEVLKMLNVWKQEVSQHRIGI
tara:strand:- start:258 stop:509 length:252 start_codon:yes stop_codon:yes gene_type:complete